MADEPKEAVNLETDVVQDMQEAQAELEAATRETSDADTTQDAAGADNSGDSKDAASTEDTKAETEAKPEGETGESEEQQQEQAATQEETKEQEPEPIEPPEHWPAGDQDAFRGLDRKGQEVLLELHKKMEAGHTQRSQEIAPLRNVMQKWEPFVQQMGTTSDLVYDGLMQSFYTLRTGTNEQKVAVLLGAARDFGVDFGQNGQAQPSEEEDPFQINKAIDQRFGPLEQKLNQIDQRFQTQYQSQQQAQQAAALDKIQRFRAEVDSEGKPKHPHFDEVMQEMDLIARGKANAGLEVDIAKVYDEACWMNLSVRDKLLSKQKAQVQTAEQQRQARRAKASGSLAGGGAPDTSKASDPNATVEDDIRASLTELAR